MCRVVALSLLIVFLLAATAFSQTLPTYDYSNYLRCTSVLKMSEYGYTTGVVANEHLVAGVDYNGLWILAEQESELSESPTHLPLGSAHWSVQLRGDLAYIAGNPSLSIVDVSIPSAPQVLSIATDDTFTYLFDLDGDYAYLACGSDGLRIVDIDDPYAPQLVATVTMTTEAEAEDVAVKDGFAYVALDESGIQILDVTDPTDPQSVTLVPVDHCRSVAIHDDDLFVGLWSALLCYEISSPGVLNLKWSLPLANRNIQDMDFVDDRVYLAAGQALSIVQITGAGAPQLLAEMPFWNNNPMSVAVRGDRAYVADYGEYFFTIDIRDLEIVTPIDSVAMCLDPVELVAHDDLVYGRGFDGIECYRIESNGALTLAGTVDHAYGTPYGGAALQNVDATQYLWTADFATYYPVLQLFDVTDPTAMFLADTQSVGRTPRDMSAEGDFLVTIDSTNWVYLYYVADPFNRLEFKDYETAFDLRKVVMQNGNIYLAGEDMFQINWIDWTDLSLQTSSVALPGEADELCVADDFAFIGINDRIIMIDVSDRTLPVVVDELQLSSWVSGLAARDGWGYAACDLGTVVFGYSEPSGLWREGNYFDTEQHTDAALGEACLFALGQNELLTAVPLQTPSTVPVMDDSLPASRAQFVRLDSVCPNPSNPHTVIRFDLAVESSVRLDILDLVGRRVATLVDERLTAGAHTISWNGRSSAGLPQASGVYLVRLESGSGVDTGKLTLVR